MIRVTWRRDVLDVGRVVLPADGWAEFEQTLIPLARRFGLAVADERCLPAAGDFWLGCRPGDDTLVNRLGWASRSELGAAVLALLAGRYGYPLGGRDTEETTGGRRHAVAAA